MKKKGTFLSYIAEQKQLAKKLVSKLESSSLKKQPRLKEKLPVLEESLA